MYNLFIVNLVLATMVLDLMEGSCEGVEKSVQS